MYNWPKNIKTWRVGNVLYISVVFSWHIDAALKIKNEFSGKTYIGGPAFNNPTYCGNFDPISIHNPLATVTSRGCPNRCGFCCVPKTEGDFQEIKNFRPAPLVCDNNFLESSMSHINKVIDKLKVFPFVDFQGFDARRFTKEKAELIGQLKCKARFGFDGINDDAAVKNAVDLCRKYTTNDIGIYCLIGYNDTPDEALAKLETVRAWNIRPTPQRFQPLNTKIKNSYIPPGWTDYELKKIMKYYSRLRYLEHIPFNEFIYGGIDPNQGSLFNE